MAKEDPIQLTKDGLYVPAGGFYIDPWRPVERALITHGHMDHARWGHKHYFCVHESVPILKSRLGEEISIDSTSYGKEHHIGSAKISFHPAGHVLGSAQIRVEVKGEVWVITGDYKRDEDPSCADFEVVPCDTLITEATFALPIYRWRPGDEVAEEIFRWWESNRERGVTSIIFGYSLGKAQRVLCELGKLTDRTVYLHGAMKSMVEVYRDAGVSLIPTKMVSDEPRNYSFPGDLIMAPPSAYRSPWMKRFKQVETAFASGWMAVRGSRRRRGYDRGFVMSDHADWDGLIQTIEETCCERVLATHGESSSLTRFVQENMGIEALALETRFVGDEEE